MTDKVYRTYDEWLEEDMHVVSGEKAHKWDDEDTALFSEDQVMTTTCMYCGVIPEECFCDEEDFHGN